MKKANTMEDQPFVTSTSNGILTASTGFSQSDIQMTDDLSSPSETFSQEPAANFSAHNKNFSLMDKKLNKLEDQLYTYLFRNLSQSEMSHVNKFFLVPIGLPGMGKSTMSRFLSANSQKYFNERFNQGLSQSTSN